MSLQFVITDNSGTELADISQVCSSKKATRSLNLPATASGRVPSHLASTVQVGNRLKVRLDGSIFFNGIIWNLGDDGDENTMYTQFTAIDPMVYWGSRPARDADGDFSKPSFITTFVTGPQIMAQILANSVTYEGALGIALGTGTVQTGGANLTGAPVDWPITIADVFSLLNSTGELDVVLTPLDGGANMATFNAYNGNYGTDRTGSVFLDYQTGAYNVRRLTRTQDLQTLCNKLWYYLGPRKLGISDPAGDQHWRGNITGDGYPDGAGGALPLPNPPGGDVNYSNPLGDLINASRAKYGVLMDIRIYDGDGVNSAAPLYARLWQTEEKLRVNGRTMVNATPIRGLAPTFDIGDQITVRAGSAFRGGLSGTQRVYGYTLEEDDDGVLGVTAIACSADQEVA